MKMREICTPEVIYCTGSITVLHAARMMRERHVGDLVVVGDDRDDQTPIGIVTDRDIVIEVLAKELDPAKVTVREIMRVPLVIAHADEQAECAIERMKIHGVRRIAVLDDQSKLTGILSLDDLLKRLAADAALLAEIVAHEQDREQRVRR